MQSKNRSLDWRGVDPDGKDHLRLAAGQQALRHTPEKEGRHPHGSHIPAKIRAFRTVRDRRYEMTPEEKYELKSLVRGFRRIACWLLGI
jgi:hypothetical protein